MNIMGAGPLLGRHQGIVATPRPDRRSSEQVHFAQLRENSTGQIADHDAHNEPPYCTIFFLEKKDQMAPAIIPIAIPTTIRRATPPSVVGSTHHTSASPMRNPRAPVAPNFANMSIM